MIPLNKWPCLCMHVRVCLCSMFNFAHVIRVLVLSVQAGQVMCRRMVCDCDNPNADLFCCPECDPRLSSQCLHQNGLLTYGSGDTWVENCQQCQCLVSRDIYINPDVFMKFTSREFSQCLYPEPFYGESENNISIHCRWCRAHTRNVTNMPVSMEMLTNKRCAL